MFCSKGTVSQDFLLQVFSWIIFPQASENPQICGLTKFKLSFACTKLYKVKTADSRCHSLPRGNYIPWLNLLKGPPPPHTHKWRKYILRVEGGFHMQYDGNVLLWPKSNERKKAWSSSTCLLYGITFGGFMTVVTPCWNFGPKTRKIQIKMCVTKQIWGWYFLECGIFYLHLI
jgi:hypothetical protein